MVAIDRRGLVAFPQYLYVAQKRQRDSVSARSDVGETLKMLAMVLAPASKKFVKVASLPLGVADYYEIPERFG